MYTGTAGTAARWAGKGKDKLGAQISKGDLGHVGRRLLEGVLAVGLARRDELRREEGAPKPPG